MSLVIKIRGIIRNFPLGNEVVKVLKGIDLDINRGEYVDLKARKLDNLDMDKKEYIGPINYI